MLLILNYLYSLFKTEYYPVVFFFITAILLSTIICSCSFILSIQKPELEKLTTYKCGFEPYNDSRNKFDIKFYLIAIIFFNRLF